MQLFSLLLLIATTFASAPKDAKNPCYNAIARHVQEAITYNKKVSPIYKKLSEGRSTLLSASLVTLEKASLLLTRSLDKDARSYQEKGIPLLCNELAEMKEIPPFKQRLPLSQRPIQLFNYDPKIISKKLKRLMDKNKLEHAYQEIALDLEELENFPHQLCLTRHLLESIARTLLLAEKNRTDSLNLDLPDPLPLIKKFIKLQRQSLELFHLLDHRAFPLQKEGLLIYCQDIPAISWKTID